MVKGRTANEQKIIDLVYEYGQQHVLRFWNELTDDQKTELINDIKECDFKLLENFYRILIKKEKLERSVLPPRVIPVAESKEDYKRERKAKKDGEDFLRSSRIAVFTAAGGQSSRLGIDAPKGTFPITPLKHKSLFQVHAEKIQFVQKKYGIRVPWVIMVSETNREATINFFNTHRYFGLEKELVRFIEQGMFPAIDQHGKLFLKEKHRLFLSPNGHGGTFSALRNAGVFDWFDELGIEEIFYFQVDNVLVKILDPIFVGYHVGNRCEMSSKCVYKDNPEEKIGVFVVENGKTTVIEYIEIESIKKYMGDNAPLFTAGNIAIHLLNVDFARKENVSGLKLPFHLAHKVIPFIDGYGKKVVPENPNGYKFETFIFDALRDVNRTIVMEVRREEEFSPLKNRIGENSPEMVIRNQLKFFMRWFEDAGIIIPKNTEDLPRYKLEVSPLFAAYEEDFIEKINGDIVINQDTYIE